MERWRRCRKVKQMISPKSHFLYYYYCFFLFLSSVCSLFTIISIATPCQQDISSSMLSGHQAEGIHIQENAKTHEEKARSNNVIQGQGLVVPLSLARRFLGGPGSSPPRCTSKCGNCTPCKPVHVAVPPGTPVTAEYYPEAWRCKCGNKLYMP